MSSLKKERDFLKKERKKRGLTQGEVAKYVGIHISTYSNIERGDRNPSLKVSLKMADFFGIDIRRLKG